jgi:conjugative relaxase-like TrwC/TraI family protein
MVTFSKALTVEHAGNYYEQHYSTKIGEYYAPTQETIVGQAMGKGAEALGIAGDVTAEQFEALLHGRDPASDAMLRLKASRADANERAGWDCTMSPPKSISIQALVAGDTRLIEADRQAAMRALREAEACALGRRRGGQEWVQSANLIAVMFEHFDARESINGQHGPMPQLHHHFFLMNATQLPGGEWRSLDPDQLMKSRNAIDAIYLSELSRNVRQVGYQIVRGPDGTFELAGYTRQQIEAFSERGQDIKRVEAQAGITNPKDARAIRLETRKPKRHHDPATLKAEREALAAQHGISLTNHPIEPVRTFPVTPDYQAERSLDFAVRHATNRQAVVDHRDIIIAALRHGVGATDLDHLQAQIDAQRDRRRLIAVGMSSLHPLDRYTTSEMVRLERENRALVRDGMNQGRPIAGIAIRSAVNGKVSSTGTREVHEWAATHKLLPDQTDAAVLTLTSGHWATAIEGLAGTAKTSLVGAMKDFAQDHGWTVRGFGTTSGSVEALTQAGVDAQTITKLRTTPPPAKTGHELWIVDESSLLATVPVNELLKLAKQRGVERIVFVGDQKQHLAIEAGAPMRQLLEDNLAVARLTTIRRQKEPGLLRAVEMAAAARTEEAIDLLVEQKRLIEIKEPAARYDRIAAEYLNAYEARQNCLVVSPANEERKDINRAVRAKLVASGYVQSLGQKHQILIPRDMTDPQKQDARSYHEAEVIYFRRGSKAQQIPKRAYLTVAAVNDETLTLRAENGRLVQFDPSHWKGLSVYTTEDRTIAVGDRLQWREPDHSHRIANGKYATITALDPQNIEVKFDNGRKLAMPLGDARKVDLGYCSTSHASQGSTVQKVIINVDSTRHVDLVNLRQWYVSLSRSELDARVYTDSVQGMRRAVARTQEKELALDVVEKPRQQHRHSAALRI